MSALPRTIRIGRDAACDLVLSDRSVSRRHADLLIAASGAMEILDLESSSGTYLVRDGRPERVTRAELAPDDVLHFGAVELSLKELLDRIDKLSTELPPPPGKKGTPTALPRLPKGTVVAAMATGAITGVRMVRCRCGTIKKKDSPCPSCGA
jgi:pSer/pThr/pTyr-binding forkhead associated (FHA) protein